MSEETLITFKTGGISEFSEFIIALNHKLSEYDSTCHHCKDGYIPMMVIARNEGGFNTTEVCAQCIMLAVDLIMHPTEPQKWCPEIESIKKVPQVNQ